MAEQPNSDHNEPCNLFTKALVAILIVANCCSLLFLSYYALQPFFIWKLF